MYETVCSLGQTIITLLIIISAKKIAEKLLTMITAIDTILDTNVRTFKVLTSYAVLPFSSIYEFFSEINNNHVEKL